ncbi:DUF6580 family putative transport protein [Parasediminibacterium sp. JCM 36343]|uniref:DUF6580 family putative transport protein n=1 Tax=Parasediminibacterium sp. JCM 36343 TaxID=3374279 RepID=UPI00397B62A3
MKLNYRLFTFTVILIAITTLSKLFFSPKLAWSGFSPVIAIALFSGMMVKDKSTSFLLPLLALFISDLIIEVLFRVHLFPFAGLYTYQLLNYSLLLITTLLGWALKGKTYTNVFIGAIAAPTLFFLLSNFSVWVSAQLTYSRDINGLVACIVNGLPFYKHSVAATLIYLPSFLLLYNGLIKKQSGLIIA